MAARCGTALYKEMVVRQIHIPKFISSISVRYVNSIFKNTTKKEFFDGEHVIKYHNRLFLMYFDSLFCKQTPHYHIGNPLLPDDLFANGGGERNIYGITDTGIGINTPTQNIFIKPNSLCHIHFPGSPPVIHQFYGIKYSGEGTALLSYHNNKNPPTSPPCGEDYNKDWDNSMKMHTIFTTIQKHL